MKATPNDAIGTPVSIENVRRLVISQLSFLNTLSIQIQNDYRKLRPINEYGDEEPLIANIDVETEDAQCIQSILLNSIYQRCRLIQKQLLDLNDWVQMVDIPDGKLKSNIGIAIRASTRAISQFKPFCDNAELIDRVIDDCVN